MADTSPIIRAEFNAMIARMVGAENRIRDYLMKRREVILIELGFIEDELGIPRTKEKRIRHGGD